MRPVHLGETIATSLRLARSAAPAAALASGLMSPAASAATGDLDPSFADLGRAYALLNLEGAAWSLEPQAEDWLLGGGDFYDYYGTYVEGFAQRLTGSGAIDATFAPLGIANTEILDVAVAADGSMIGVGRTLQTTPSPQRLVLTVFRLGPNGARDAAFGVDGVVQLFQDGLRSVASSVVLESDGRVAVAGVRDSRLVVVRLLANGTLDATFAAGGIYTGASNDDYLLPKILRVADGGYRVTNQGGGCQVLALAPNGVPEASFGEAGLAGLSPASRCYDMTALEDGRLVVAGRAEADAGFAVRLLASGEPDATFEASAVADAIREVTALEATEGGSIILAGRGAEAAGQAAVVMRLKSDGKIDTAFGDGGQTLIDLPSEFGTLPTVHDIALGNGRVLLAGGDGQWQQRPFVARLLGNDDPGGPGVIGVARPGVDVRQQDGEAVLTVRRMGGRSGRVSVLVRTQGGPDATAVAGEDYTVVDRRLTWEDGDAADRQLVIPLLPDLAGAVAEEYESIKLVLSDIEGGAGLGTWASWVGIAADGEPAGQFAIDIDGNQLPISESAGTAGTRLASVRVSRRYYYTGPVSVRVIAVGGTAAAGSDFDATPVTLAWADGESADKFATFRIIDDRDREEAETFSVQLSATTGGAVIGPYSSVEFTIARNDQPSPSSGSGGGTTGLLSLLLLGGAEWARRAARRWFGRGYTVRARS